jgi:4-hydroxy-3-polyprenylbenzoate decarboxylase
MKRFVLAITGASSSILGIRLLEELLKVSEVHLIISSNTFSIIRDEIKSYESGVISQELVRVVDRATEFGKQGADKIEDIFRKHFKTERLFFYDDRYLWSPVASGSFKTDGMLVVPCSMKTLSSIANGYASNLIERAADVTIKEGRPLLLSPREMPFSAIHLENMLKLSRLGVKIAPPVIAFYHNPQKISDIIDFIVGKILDAFGIEHELFKRWGTIRDYD